MDEVVYLFTSGTSLFWGAGLVAAAGVLSGILRLRVTRAIVRVAAAVGMAMVVVSSAPLPVWVYPVWCGAVVAWLIREATSAAEQSSAVLRGAIVVSCLIIALSEGARYVPPPVPVAPAGTVYVIGDSLSAGMGAGQRLWPEVLDDLIRQDVVNLAEAGATTASAWGQAAEVEKDPATVLVLIGGDDLLGGVPAEEFETSLRRLLGTAGRGLSRRIVMFELPRGPFRNAYGHVQREVAEEFGSLLIPRHVLARVITSPGATLDGLHLSDEGHALLAETVAELAEVEPELSLPARHDSPSDAGTAEGGPEAPAE